MLELEEHQKFQERVWVFQRLGWVALAIFLLAAIAGYTGPSQLTEVKAAEGSAEVRYPKFGRKGTAYQMVVRPGTEREVFFSREFQENVELQTVLPEPLETESFGDGIVFRFKNPGGAVTFDWKPRRGGSMHARIRIGAAELPFAQFVYF